MSDQIISFVKYNNPNGDGKTHRYEITFSFFEVNVPAELCTVYIASQIMTNPDDAQEAKDKAVALAKTLKALYASPLSNDDMVGPVAL